MVMSASAVGVLSAAGGSKSTLANALLTAQLMFCGMVSVALGDEVNPGIRPPLAGPLVPQPDLLQLCPINRVSFEEPLADVFPLRAASVRIRIERVEESREAGRGHVWHSLLRGGGGFNAGRGTRLAAPRRC